MTALDWTVVTLVVVLSMLAGTAVVRLAWRHGAISYFTSDRNLPWWAIAMAQHRGWTHLL